MPFIFRNQNTNVVLYIVLSSSLGILGILAFFYLQKRRVSNKDIKITDKSGHNNVSTKNNFLKNVNTKRERIEKKSLDYSILFEKNAQNILFLNFLPDTKSPAKDIFLLILYAYKIEGNDTVEISKINKSLSLSHGKRLKISSIIPYLMDSCDRIAEDLIPVFVSEKTNLSRGGTYRLTQEGENYARSLAQDLIQRA